MKMRFLAALNVALAILASAALAQTPGPKPVGNMKQFMVDVVYPTSNAIFYIRDGPANEKEWIDLETYALMLGESANLLMAPERARDKDQWMKDAKLLWDVGDAAYKLVKARNVKGIADLNADLYEACQSCHVHYRPGYRRRE